MSRRSIPETPATAGSTLRGTPRSTTTSGARPAVAARAAPAEPSISASRTGRVAPVDTNTTSAGTSASPETGEARRRCPPPGRRGSTPDPRCGWPPRPGRGRRGRRGRRPCPLPSRRHPRRRRAARRASHRASMRRARRPRGTTTSRPGRWQWSNGHGGPPARRGGKDRPTPAHWRARPGPARVPAAPGRGPRSPRGRSSAALPRPRRGAAVTASSKSTVQRPSRTSRGVPAIPARNS